MNFNSKFDVANSRKIIINNIESATSSHISDRLLTDDNEANICLIETQIKNSERDMDFLDSLRIKISKRRNELQDLRLVLCQKRDDYQTKINEEEHEMAKHEALMTSYRLKVESEVRSSVVKTILLEEPASSLKRSISSDEIKSEILRSRIKKRLIPLNKCAEIPDMNQAKTSDIVNEPCSIGEDELNKSIHELSFNDI